MRDKPVEEIAAKIVSESVKSHVEQCQGSDIPLGWALGPNMGWVKAQSVAGRFPLYESQLQT